MGSLTVPDQTTAIVGFKANVEKWSPELAKVAYRGFTADRVLTAALHAAVHEPKLFDATPVSLRLALVKVARWGLDIGDTVHLVPLQTKVKRNGQETYVTRVEAWPDYKGLKALAMRQGIVRGMEEFPVYAADRFEYALGLDAFLRHVPVAAKDRGKLIGAYSIIRLPYGAKTFHYLPIEDVDAIRKSSRSWGLEKFPACPPWYAMKTVVRDYLNRQPKQGALSEALAADDTEPEPPIDVDPETGEILSQRPAALDQRTPADDDLDRRLDGEG